MSASIDLTVAVCTYRRYAWLSKCLEGLARQTLARDRFRVVVVDNSLQPSESERFQKRLPKGINIEYIVTEKSGLSYARNIALAKADTPYIAYLDDDAIPAPDWAARLVDAFRKHNGKAGVIGGKARPFFETPKPDWLAGELLLYLAIPDWGEDSIEIVPGDGKWLVGANIAYLTQALRASGGFPEQLGRKESLLLCHEEFWINQAIRCQGLSLQYEPQIVVDHLIQAERMTPVWLCEAAFWEAVSWVLCHTSSRSIDVVSDANKKQLLLDELAKLRHRIPKNPKTKQLEILCLDFKEAGYATMRKLGFSTEPTEDSIGKDTVPTVYLITTCRNAADTIDETIRSIVTQTGNFFIRYHVQDSNSDDDTVSVIKKWQADIQAGKIALGCAGVHISYMSERDTGMYDGIARGFSHLTIPADAFMTWLNADDILFPGAIAAVVEIQQTLPQVDWLTGYIYCTRNTGGLCQATPCGFPQWFLQQGLCETRYWQFVQQEGTFWRKRLWDRAGGLNVELRLAGDYDLWRRFSEHAELWHFQGPLASFRRRLGQLSENHGKYCEETDSIVPKAEKDKSWEFAANAISSGTNQFMIACIYYDWGADAYKETYGPVTDFMPPWKKHLAPLSPPAQAKKTSKTPQATLDHLSLESPKIEELSPEAQETNTVGVSAPSALSVEKTRRTGRSSAFSQLKRWKKRAQEYQVIRASGLFHDSYYLHNNPDVAAIGIDPLLHYLRHGAWEGRDPNPAFKSMYYLMSNPDVKAEGINPLLHFIEFGASEERNPNSQFNTRTYLNENPLLRETRENPLSHFLRSLDGQIPVGIKAAEQPVDVDKIMTRGDSSPQAITDSAAAAPLPTIDNFEFYAYSKRSHLPILATYAQDLYGHPCPDFDEASLKLYQDLLAYAFIRLNIPPGSRILEIGGGHSRVLERLSPEYECWNADRFEGLGGGPSDIPNANYRIVREFIGAFSPELPENYFDFVFSISVLEHLPTDNPTILTGFLKDIARIKKENALQLHLIDHAINTVGWQHPILPILTKEMRKSTGVDIDVSKLVHARDIYHMSERAYNAQWLPTTNIPFVEFGFPVSANVLSHSTRPANHSAHSVNENQPKAHGLIYDIGMHKCEDTAFYLAKGFRVVAVEANKTLCDITQSRFANAILSGQLIIVNAAIAEKCGFTSFYINKKSSEWSSAIPEIARRDGHECDVVTVPARTLKNIIEEFGIPYYVKIDIEGHDHIAVHSLTDSNLRPKYISVENGALELSLLINLGYRWFKYVQQRDVQFLKPPYPALEGDYVPYSFEFGASGLFGEELEGPWLSADEIRSVISKYWNLTTFQKQPTYDDQIDGWFDLHAKL